MRAGAFCVCVCVCMCHNRSTIYLSIHVVIIVVIDVYICLWKWTMNSFSSWRIPKCSPPIDRSSQRSSHLSRSNQPTSTCQPDVGALLLTIIIHIPSTSDAPTWHGEVCHHVVFTSKSSNISDRPRHESRPQSTHWLIIEVITPRFVYIIITCMIHMYVLLLSTWHCKIHIDKKSYHLRVLSLSRRVP